MHTPSRLALLAAGSMSLLLSTVSVGNAAQTIFSYVTFYGFDDNDDGNPSHTGTSVISNPAIHKVATEDFGTYDHPGTLATDKNFLPPGTIVYVPALKRYYVMEDTCRECSQDWKKNKAHVDIFVSGTGPALAACESRLTMEKARIIIDPPRNLPVKQGSACNNRTKATRTPSRTRNKTAGKCSKSRNQCSVERALSKGIKNKRDPAASALTVALEQQSRESELAALDALSGEIHATTQSVLMNDSRFVREAILGRLMQAYYTTSTGQITPLGAGGPMLSPSMLAPPEGQTALPLARASDLGLWTNAYGSWTNFDGGQESAGTDSSVGGFISGLDTRVFGNWRAGIAGGYSQSNFSTDGLHSSGVAKTTHLGVYTGGELGPFALRGGGAWAWSAIDTSRDVMFPGFFEHEAASYSANLAQAFGEVAYPVNLNGIAVEPFADLAYVSATTESFKEQGGIAALRSSNNTTDVGYSVLGLRAARTFEWDSTAVTPHFSAAWQHAFGDVEPDAVLTFIATGSSFDVVGVPLAEDSLLVETGFDFDVSQNATLGFAYSGQFSDSVQDNAVKGRFIWRF